jgi:hypothetical protein
MRSGTSREVSRMTPHSLPRATTLKVIRGHLKAASAGDLDSFEEAWEDFLGAVGRSGQSVRHRPGTGNGAEQPTQSPVV